MIRIRLCLPASGSAAWQHQTAVCDGKTDFLGTDRAAELRNQLCGEHVGEDGWSQSRGVGVNQVK